MNARDGSNFQAIPEEKEALIQTSTGTNIDQTRVSCNKEQAKKIARWGIPLLTTLTLSIGAYKNCAENNNCASAEATALFAGLLLLALGYYCIPKLVDEIQQRRSNQESENDEFNEYESLRHAIEKLESAEHSKNPPDDKSNKYSISNLITQFSSREKKDIAVPMQEMEADESQIFRV